MGNQRHALNDEKLTYFLNTELYILLGFTLSGLAFIPFSDK